MHGLVVSALLGEVAVDADYDVWRTGPVVYSGMSGGNAYDGQYVRCTSPSKRRAEACRTAMTKVVRCLCCFSVRRGAFDVCTTSREVA